MGITANVSLLAVGASTVAYRTAVTEHYALRVITSPTNSFWFPGGPDQEDRIRNVHPGADIRKAHLASVPDFQEDGGFLSGEISIGNGSYSIADIERDGSDAMAERFANRQAMKGAVLALYQAEDEGDFTEETRVRTSIGVDMRDSEGELIIDFESVHTLLRGKLFSPVTLKLSASLKKEDEVVKIQIPDGYTSEEAFPLPVFEHDDAYSTDPGKTISYWLTSENEVISTVATGAKVVDGFMQFPIYKREQFGSLSVDIDLEEDELPANYPEISEFIFLEENPGDMLLLSLAGETSNGRTAPASGNWSRNLGLGVFSLASFDYTGATLERQHFAGLKEQDTKTFVDKRVLGEVFATLLDDEQGRFELRTRASFVQDAVSIATLDENNIHLDSALEFGEYTDQLRRTIFIKHGYNSIRSSYEMADIKINATTLPGGMYGELDDITYEYQGWNTAVGTISQLYLRASILQDLHHAMMLRTNVELLPNMNHIRVGDVVTLDLRRVPVVFNTKTGDPIAIPPFLSMLVVARAGNSETKRVQLALVASTGSAERSSRSGEESVLDPSEYDRIAPTALSSVVAPTAGLGGRELYSGTHIVAPNKWYRIDNMAILDTDFQLRPSTTGQFIGIAHKEELTVMSTLGAIYGAGMGAYAGTRSAEGTPGFIGRTSADGSINIKQMIYENSSGTAQRGQAYMTSRPQTQATRPTQETFNGFNMQLIANRLAGIPSRLAGSGGQGGGVVTGYVQGTGSGGYLTTFVNALSAAPPAAQGGRGGMAALFMGKRLSWASSAVLWDVSGEDGQAGSPVAGAVAGSGAGGSPAIGAVIVDGNHTVQPFNATSVKAFNGECVSTYDHATQEVTGLSLKQSWFQGTPKLNRWDAHSAVSYIPASDNFGDRPLNAFDQLAEDEAGLDGKITLHLIPDTADPVFPENADANDLAVFEVDARNLAKPVTAVRIYRLTRAAGWVRVEFPDIIAEFKITSFRDRGTTVTWVRETRPSQGLYAIGDSWYHPASRRMYILGATAAEDTLVSADTFSDHTGFNLLADPNWVDYASGKDTLSFHQSWDEPLRSESSAPTTTGPEAPGQTAASYIILPATNFDYKEEGAFKWDVVDGVMVSSAGSSTGHARAFYGFDEGFVSDDSPRKTWAYARTTTGSASLIIQGGGFNGGEGTPSQQQAITVTGSEFTWLLLPGTFGPYHSQAHLRTSSAGLEVKSFILIDQNSSSVPAGDAGFGAGSGTALSERPFWAAPTSGDRQYPAKNSQGRGPFQLLDTGEGNSLAWRVDFSGAGVPNIVTERFPWKAKPGTQYRATARVRVRVTNGFSLPQQMGVAAQIEGFDDSGNKVFTTDVQNGDDRDWFSINGSGYTDVVQIIDVPNTVNRLAWGALKVVVMGNASGYAEIDSCEMVELPYRANTFFSKNLQYLTLFKGPGAETVDIVTIPMACKKGMRVSTRLEGYAKADRVDAGSYSPSLRILGVFRSVDLFGNSVGSVIDHPNILTHRTSSFRFPPKIGDNINDDPPYLTTEYQPFSGSTDFIATTDISRVVVRATGSNGSNSNSEACLFEDFTFTLIYGEVFDGDI